MHFVLKNNKTYTNVKAVQVSKKSITLKKAKSKINSICIKRKQKEKLLKNSYVKQSDGILLIVRL